MATAQSRPSLSRFQAVVTQPQPDGAELYARALQSSVAEGHADSEKAGPQAQSALPARSHLQRTAETAPTEHPLKNAREDKARDPE